MFFSSNDPGVNSVLSKFTEECKLLSSLSHPNIVQFIGVCNLDEQGPHPTPVLLTELMDESLMTFIARSRDSLVFIPFHVEVNISHDIALALSYLHSKNIIHRDLSSNNVLLVGTRAKVTDFGVAKLYDLQSQYTKYQTQCPGTPPFMSPESLLTPPKYTTKLDVFSWAVICIHLLSRHAPNPSPHLRRQVDSNGREVFVKVLEQERRAMDMSPIVQDHLLLPIALTCLSDDAESRPTADELCDLLEKVKMNEIYKDDTKVPAGEIGLRKELLHCEDEIKNLKAKVDEVWKFNNK
jgi:serine/threonine-protein kinase TNNI3K